MNQPPDLTIDKTLLEPIVRLYKGLTAQLPPVLSHFHVHGDGDEAVLYATDLSVGLQVRLPASFENPEPFLLPTRKTLDILANLPADATLRFSHHGSDCVHLSASGCKARYTLPILDAPDYPAVPDCTTAAWQTFDTAQLTQLLTHTAFAADNPDHHRPASALTGLLLRTVNGGPTRLHAVATNGHRLAYAAAPTDDPEAAAFNDVLPKHSTTFLRDVLDPQHPTRVAPLAPHPATRILAFAQPARTLFIRLLDTIFPDYQPLTQPPPTVPAIAHVDPQRLTQALLRVRHLAHQKNPAVTFTFDPGGLLTLHTEDGAGGLAEDTFEVRYDTPPPHAARLRLNPDYLLDALGNMLHGDVHIPLGDPGEPIRLHTPEQPDQVYVVMPIRLD